MAQTIDMKAILKLSTVERVELIDKILDSLLEDDAEIPISPDTMAELKRRSKELRDNPGSGLTHKEVMNRLEKKQWR